MKVFVLISLTNSILSENLGFENLVRGVKG